MKIRIFNHELTINQDRFPWCPINGRWDQPNRKNYGWKNLSGMGRFGGGWDHKLGFAYSHTKSKEYQSSTLILELFIGMIRINAKRYL